MNKEVNNESKIKMAFSSTFPTTLCWSGFAPRLASGDES